MRLAVSIDFADFWHPNTLEAKRGNFLYQLLAKRFDLVIEPKPEFLLYSCFGGEFRRHRGVRIHYSGENRRPNFALCDWAFTYDFNDHPRHFRLPYYVCVHPTTLLQPRDVDALWRGKSKFCAFVYSNGKPRERIRLMELLSRYKPVDCGGQVRNNIGYRVDDKMTFLRPYKFDIAFENERHPGYTSEKIAQAFLAGAVPIYWGNPLIGRDFNTAAFVNSHDFRNLNQVADVVVELDRNDDLYRRYLGAPALPNGRITPYIDENRILNRFEEIFTTRSVVPVAHSWRGRLGNYLQALRRRKSRQRGRNAA